MAAPLALFLLALSLSVLARHVARAQGLYEQPVLVINQDMHTASIRSGAVDSDGQYAATGSEDKTVRIWSLADGKLLKTIRIPAGPGYIGQIYAVAMSPDGSLVAAGGWTTGSSEESLYLLDRETGQIVKRIGDLDNTVSRLAFSKDGRYLAVGSFELRIYDKDKSWSEVFRDSDFEKYVYGISFADDYHLAATSYDGKVKLYSPDGQGGFTTLITKVAKRGETPHGIAFSADGNVLALGYVDVGRVDLLDGHSLESLPGPAPSSEGPSGSIPNVAWSKDGTLFGEGYFGVFRGHFDVFIWADAGRGERRTLNGSSNTIRSLEVLKDGRVFFAAAYELKCLKSDGSGSWGRQTTVTRFQPDVLVSTDGKIVDFGLNPGGRALLRFDVAKPSLSVNPPDDHLTSPPKKDGLLIENVGGHLPTLNNQPIQLDDFENSRSFAIHPNGNSFVLGTSWALRAIDANNKHLWRHDTPAAVRAVNITGDGKLVVALYDDGTIRWHSMMDGAELLALFVHSKGHQNCVVWTPKGYYAASIGAEDLIGWHVNRDQDHAADFFPISRFRDKFYRPDIIGRILADLNEEKAITQADLAVGKTPKNESIEVRLPPVVHIVSPFEHGGVRTSELTMEFTVRSPSGLQVERVFAQINGRPVEGAETGPISILDAKEEFKGTLRVKVPSRDVKLSVMAETKQNWSDPDSVNLIWMGARQPRKNSRLYALIIGVGSYDNYKPDKSANLVAPPNDADDIATQLKSEEKITYQTVETKVLKDRKPGEEATLANIMAGLKWLRKSATQIDDVALVYFSGHGLSISDGGAYLLPVEFIGDVEDGLNKKTLLDVLRNINAQVVVFIDACHAGAELQLNTIGLINEFADPRNGIIAFASSLPTEHSYGVGRNSIFTQALIEALLFFDRRPEDRDINTQGVYGYLTDRVPALVPDEEQQKGNTQTPIMLMSPAANPIVLARRPDDAAR